MNTAAGSSQPAANNPLLSVRNLKKEFPIKKGVFSRQVGAVKAVNDVSFDVAQARPSASWGNPAVARPPQRRA